MDLENIKNSIKESIIQNFMENAKHARRGPSHQRPKSWSKGTKSGSDKKKMRREGKDATQQLQEQGPMGWHEGDPELESDVLAKHTASLSPEERDPFHLIDAEDRENIHDTLQRPHGAHLVRAGLLGRIQSIAGMAKQTPTGKDDPNAMKRISQLIDYGNKAIDQHMKDYMSSSDGRDIPH